MAHDRDDDTVDLSEIVKKCKDQKPTRPSAQQSAAHPPRYTRRPPAQPTETDTDDLWDFDADWPADSGELFDDDIPQPDPTPLREHVFDFDLSEAQSGSPQLPHSGPNQAHGKWHMQRASHGTGTDTGETADETELEDEDAYDWAPLPQDAEDDAIQRGNAYGSSQPRKRRRKRKFWRFLLTLLILLILVVTAVVVFAKAPERDTEGLGSRVGDTVNVLIAGTDQDGTRTDTIMLVSISKKSGKITLTSVPRDTLVENVYSAQKINSVYGYNGTGSDGMEALMAELTEILGITPDGYVLVNLDVFIQLVDLMGGVWFDVPQDMHYEDPTQNLYIDLTAGYQKLDGQKAMQLVRYRSYAMADLQRVNVQRDFIQAALNQWLSVKGILHAPQAVKLIQQNAQTDLSFRNMVWLALAMKACGTEDMATMTLPGAAGMFDGVSYFILDEPAVVDTVNQTMNPYQQAVTTDRVQIKTYE